MSSGESHLLLARFHLSLYLTQYIYPGKPYILAQKLGLGKTFSALMVSVCCMPEAYNRREQKARDALGHALVMLNRNTTLLAVNLLDILRYATHETKSQGGCGGHHTCTRLPQGIFC